MHLTKEQKEALHPINIIVFFLSVYVIVALVLDTVFRFQGEIHQLLLDIDYVICGIFFIDFLHRLFTAKNKWEYMKWGWIDLLSSIPVSFLPAGRLLRVVQLLRVVRAIRSIKFLSHYFLKNKIKSAFTSAALLAFVMIVFCAIAMLKFEKDVPNSQIKTAEDALWWAYVTITTVGYGDKVPVTTEGRIIATILMTVGVGLFGTFTAYVASWFVARKVEEDEEQRLNDIKKELREKTSAEDKNPALKDHTAQKKRASV